MRCLWLGVPDEYRSALDPHLTHWEPIVPRWLELLSVRVMEPDEGDPDTMLAILPEPEYRQAKLYVYPRYLQQTPRDRRSAVLHEFIHIALRPAEDVFSSLLDATVDDDDAMNAWAESEHRRAIEACVTDLELGLGRLLDPHKDGHA